MTEIKKVLKNYKFLSLWISQILSQLTINILSFVILIHIYNQTKSTIASSLLWIAYALPAVIAGPIASAAVDLLEKRKVLMFVNLSQSIVVITFAILLYKNLIFLPYAIVFLYSLLNQIYIPAEASTLPLLVKEEDLPSANGLFFITQQSSLAIGFGMAGILDQIFGFRPTLILVSISLLIGFISVSFIPKRKPSTKLPESFEKKFALFFEQMIEGYDFIKNTQKILFPFLLLLGVQVILAVLVVNLPSMATNIVNIPAGSSGFALVLPAGFGAIIGTIFISKLISQKVKKRKIMLTALWLLSVSILFVGVFVPLVGNSAVKIAVSITLFIIAGASTVGTLVPTITYLQENTPKDLLGRVFGNFWFLTTLATVLPVLFSATITDLFGVRFLVILLGLACLGVVAFTFRKTNVLK